MGTMGSAHPKLHLVLTHRTEAHQDKMIINLKKSIMNLILVVMLTLHGCSAFLITDAEPGIILVAPGTPVTLSCTVDDHYEWCKWFNPKGEFCDFEWKRKEGNITMQECALSNKVSFSGVYENMQCGIEEYVTWRGRGAGRIQTAQMNVTVHIPTTTAALPETTPEITTSSVSAVKSTEVSIRETSTKVQAQEKEDIEESPTAVPQVDEENVEKAGTSSTIIGIFVILIVIVVAVSGALYYRKRRNSSAATAVYEREARAQHDQTTMVPGTESNIKFHSNNGEKSNLHKYYPPSLTYTTVTPESQA